MYHQVKGVKGPSWLFCLKSFDFIKGFSPDYMHCILLGTTKTLLQLWTVTTKCCQTDHDLHLLVPVIDEHIKQITVPTEIRRSPRGIKDVKHWKGICTSIVY